MPLLSIIIPTHKRPTILRQCLEHIDKQTIADQIEVIVVSDGYDEETRKRMKNQELRIKNIIFLEITKSHQGVARNKGVKHAKGDYCLFIGDDIFLEPDACEKHLRILTTYHLPLTAVLGFTTWDPSCGITPVMWWLEKTGWQFGYGAIAKYAHSCIPAPIQHRFTYTSHLSLPTKIARENAFRDDVSHYGWEDIEWGLRLRQAGIPLYYEPEAKALHHHRITLEDSLKRMEVIGRSLAHISLKNAEFDRMPKGWKWWVYRIVSVLPTMRGRHYRAFLRGIMGAPIPIKVPPPLGED